MKPLSCPCCLMLSLLLMLYLDQCQGQNYHFSNGWQPGKRSQEICQFRSDVKTLIFKLIEDQVRHKPVFTIKDAGNELEDETSRMLTDPACYGGVGAIKHYLKKDIGYPLDKK